MINLSKLNNDRLKKYRKSLSNKLVPYISCDCGDPSCDYKEDLNKENPDYIKIKNEHIRVKGEYNRRNKIRL